MGIFQGQLTKYEKKLNETLVSKIGAVRKKIPNELAELFRQTFGQGNEPNFIAIFVNEPGGIPTVNIIPVFYDEEDNYARMKFLVNVGDENMQFNTTSRYWSDQDTEPSNRYSFPLSPVPSRDFPLNDYPDTGFGLTIDGFEIEFTQRGGPIDTGILVPCQYRNPDKGFTFDTPDKVITALQDIPSEAFDNVQLLVNITETD